MSERHPQCYVIAGPNGAGKTTFARDFLPHHVHCLEFVNPDLIALGLSPFDARRAGPAAGRVVLQRIHDLAKANNDFAMETTLSGRTYVQLLRRIHEWGYQIHMFYLWLPSPEMSLQRVADRVKRGGHDVPKADVRRRFPRTLNNLFNLYWFLLDSLYFFDASNVEPSLIFEQVEGQVQICQQAKYEKIRKKVGR